MEPIALVVDKIKGATKSGQNFIDGLLQRREISSRRNPIEILKRLQIEAFSDIMKLRDRQDKVERVLSFYKTSKGSPFEENSTHVRGEVDVSGGLLLMGDIDQQHCDALDRAGVKTGISSRLTFETIMRQKDILLAEFVASQKGLVDFGDVPEAALALAKVSYTANINDWFSAIAIPVGARFRDLEMATNSSNQRHGVTDLSSAGPPLLNQYNDAAIGLTVRKSNVIAMMAQSVSGLRRQPFSERIGHGSGTFGQIVCQLPKGIKLSLMGLQHVQKPSSHPINVGALAVPVRFNKRHKTPETPIETSATISITTSNQKTSTTGGTISVKLESELDESTKIRCWIQMNNSNTKQLHWAVNAFDDSEDEFGWGLSLSGMVQRPNNHHCLQAECYLKLNMGNNFCLKPGIAYVVDGDTKIFGLMLRSNWSF